MNKRTLVIVPARSGSKRIVAKNAKPLLGKPLLLWTLDFAMGLPGVDHIALSVDTPELAELGQSRGVPVERLRPASLASDTASSVDVALEELDFQVSRGRRFDQLLLLQPTSPFRSNNLWRRASELKESVKACAVVGVSPSPVYPEHLYRLSSTQSMSPVLKSAPTFSRTQDLEPSFVINGSLYLIDVEVLRQSRSFLPGGTCGVLSDTPHLDIDLDTPDDWAYAEYLGMHHGVKA